MAVCLLFVMGSIAGCGAVEEDINRLAAIETCREMLVEAEAPGDWEDVADVESIFRSTLFTKSIPKTCGRSALRNC